MGLGALFEDFFDAALAASVGIGGALGVVFSDGQLFGFAVDGCRGGEDDALDVGGEHGLEKVDGACHVVPVVLQGLIHRFAHLARGGEVDDAIDGVPGEELVQGLAVPKISFDETAPTHGLAMASIEVVEDDGVMIGLEDLVHVAADVAGPTGDEDGAHGNCFLEEVDRDSGKK